MNLNKTYKDFVNDVITEISNKAEAHSIGFKNLMKSNNNNNQRQTRQILRAWAEAFVQEDTARWRTQIRNIKKYVHTGTSTTTIPIYTPYQFMIYFFDTYLHRAWGWNINKIKQHLEHASETIQMEEKYYSRNTIRSIIRLVKHGQQHKQLFVHVFNSLT